MLGSYLVLNTAMTIFSVPYMAMTSDLSQDRNERSVLFALRFAFGNLGALIAAGLPVYFLTSAQSPSEKLEAMSQVSWLLAALIILSGFTSWLTVRRKKHLLQNEKTEHWSDEFKSILTNQAFWPLLIAYTVATFGVSLNSSLARYYYRYRLMMDESEVGILLVSFMIFLTMSLMGWVWISKRFGKLIPLRYGILGLGIGTSVVYLLFQPGSFWTPSGSQADCWNLGGFGGVTGFDFDGCHRPPPGQGKRRGGRNVFRDLAFCFQTIPCLCLFCRRNLTFRDRLRAEPDSGRRSKPGPGLVLWGGDLSHSLFIDPDSLPF